MQLFLRLIPMLSTGLVCLIVGLVFLRFPPKKINSLYGYRTTRSQRDIASWNFAQRFSAKAMVWASLADIAVCWIGDVLLCRMGLSASELVCYDNVIAGIACIALCVAVILPTELALARRQRSAGL